MRLRARSRVLLPKFRLGAVDALPLSANRPTILGMQRRLVLIEKLKGHDHESDVIYRYFVRPGSRRRRWIWFDPGEVPPFEGNAAMFEVERIKGGWRLARPVERASRDA